MSSPERWSVHVPEQEVAPGGSPESLARALTLQLPFLKSSESMGNHDSEIVDASSVD